MKRAALRQFSCTRCLIAGRHGVPATDMDGVTTVCADHATDRWTLCAACNYWVATVGPLCSACAGER